MRVMAEERASEESRRTRWPLPLKGLGWAGCRAGAGEGAGRQAARWCLSWSTPSRAPSAVWCPLGLELSRSVKWGVEALFKGVIIVRDCGLSSVHSGK